MIPGLASGFRGGLRQAGRFNVEYIALALLCRGAAGGDVIADALKQCTLLAGDGRKLDQRLLEGCVATLAGVAGSLKRS